MLAFEEDSTILALAEILYSLGKFLFGLQEKFMMQQFDSFMIFNLCGCRI